MLLLYINIAQIFVDRNPIRNWSQLPMFYLKFHPDNKYFQGLILFGHQKPQLVVWPLGSTRGGESNFHPEGFYHPQTVRAE